MKEWLASKYKKSPTARAVVTATMQVPIIGVIPAAIDEYLRATEENVIQFEKFGDIIP